MQVRFIMLFCVRVYNSLSYLTFHDKVWSINMSKYKPTLSGDSGQIIHFCIFSQFGINFFFIELVVSRI